MVLPIPPLLYLPDSVLNSSVETAAPTNSLVSSEMGTPIISRSLSGILSRTNSQDLSGLSNSERPRG